MMKKAKRILTAEKLKHSFISRPKLLYIFVKVLCDNFRKSCAVIFKHLYVKNNLPVLYPGIFVCGDESLRASIKFHSSLSPFSFS